jgi:hypothetical protein
VDVVVDDDVPVAPGTAVDVDVVDVLVEGVVPGSVGGGVEVVVVDPGSVVVVVDDGVGSGRST